MTLDDRSSILRRGNNPALRRRGDIRIDWERADSADALLCVDAYFKELRDRFGFGVASMASALDGCNPPAGIFLIARCGTEPVGCCALRMHRAGIGEVKRLWVSREMRGRGIAGRLLAGVEVYARARGWAHLRLDTHGSLIEARALYQKHGYREIAAYNGNPDAEHWFEKPLAELA